MSDSTLAARYRRAAGWSRFGVHWRGLAPSLLAASLLALWPGGVGGAAPAAAPDTTGLRIGVPAVPAMPTPGAKTRTAARIEVLAGQETENAAPLQAIGQDEIVPELQAAKLDAWVGVLPAGVDIPAGVPHHRLSWSASPTAMMRTDTDIRSWEDLAGRTVCLNADGRYVGELAARYGAIEQVYPSVTDALLAVRVGLCDAAVQEEAFVRELVKFPEWKKFSAQLAPYRQVNLVQLLNPQLPAANVQTLRQSVAPKHLQQLAQEQAKAIAFEVYLDQSVPDCH